MQHNTQTRNARKFRERFLGDNGTPLPASLDYVAGYGSLRRMPEPGLAYVGTGALHGYAKRFNVVERRVRGTPEHPGRVLGLVPDPQGVASAALFRIDPARRDATLASLWTREIDGLPYAARLVSVRIGGRSVRAMAFVPKAGPDVVEEDPDTIAQILLTARGVNGSNMAYFDAVNAFDREFPALRSAHLALLEWALADRMTRNSVFGLRAA